MNMRAFKQVDDESGPGVGEELGKALAPAITAMSDAVERIGKQNTDMQKMLAKAMTDALSAVDSKRVVVESQSVKQWDFQFERDSNKLLTRIVATAK